MDYWGPNSGPMTWRLTPAEVRQVLSLRYSSLKHLLVLENCFSFSVAKLIQKAIMQSLVLFECCQFKVTHGVRTTFSNVMNSSTWKYCNSFHVYGHTWGFHPQTQRFEPLFCSVTNSTTGNYCSVAFMFMVTLEDFIHRLKGLNHFVQRNKQHHRKVLLSSFHLNGHTYGFHSLTQKFELPCTA